MNESHVTYVYETYKTMVFSLTYAYLQSVTDSEDATLETFVRLMKSGKEFPTLEDERRYITRIAINVAKDMLRKKKAVPLNDHIVADEEEKSEDNEELWVEINKLPDKLKEVIILNYINDLSYFEISKTLKISEAAVRKRHERAISKLKERLGQDE